MVVSLVTVGLLVLAWRHYGGVTVFVPVQVSVTPVILALVGCGLFLVGRAWRLRALLDGRVPFAPLLGAVGISWGAGLLLPGPSADATFILLARRRFGVGLRRGASVSILARFLDMISLAAIVVVAAALSATDEPLAPVIASAAVGGVAAVFLGLCAHSAVRPHVTRILARLPWMGQWASAADDALAELSRPRQVGMLVASTILCRAATLMQYAALFSLVGLHLDIWGVWFVLAVRTILSTIPIQGLAGLGTSQVWWAGALVLEGISAASAVGISVTVSLLDLAVSVPVVLACWRCHGCRSPTMPGRAAPPRPTTPCSHPHRHPRQALAQLPGDHRPDRPRGELCALLLPRSVTPAATVMPTVGRAPLRLSKQLKSASRRRPRTRTAPGASCTSPRRRPPRPRCPTGCRW